MAGKAEICTWHMLSDLNYDWMKTFCSAWMNGSRLRALPTRALKRCANYSLWA